MADPFPTTGSRFSKDQTGLRKIDLVFVVDGPVEHGGAEPYDTLDHWSPAAPMGLAQTNRSSEKDSDGSWKLVITFEGITDGAAGDIVAEIDYAEVDDPIETFEKFNALIEKYKAKDKFYEETGKFQGFPRLLPAATAGAIREKSPVYGLKNFANDNRILVLTFVLREFRADLCKNICKIDKPLYPTGQQDLVENLDGKQWLKRTVKIQFRGNAWRYTMKWFEGIWVPDIYQPTN